MTGDQLSLFPAAPGRATKQEVAAQLKTLRRERKWWRSGCPGGHVDYGLLPGTDEGDHAARFRNDKAAEVEWRIDQLIGGES